MVRQRTLRNAIRATGTGLHTGRRIGLRLMPAMPNTGVVFRRGDGPSHRTIGACPACVGDTTLSTTLAQDGVTVSTIEHLMAALAGLGIDNVHVEVDDEEVPIMDGSASPFVFLCQSAGIIEQPTPRRYIRIKRPVTVGDADRWVRLEPHDGLRIRFTIDFDHPLFPPGGQTETFDITTTSFIKELSRARTFGFTRDIQYMRQNNLARGGGLDNAVVLDDNSIINPGGLRYDTEFVRHKILDLLGDLYLLGRPVLGAVTAYKSGHTLNNQLLRTLLADPTAWEEITCEEFPHAQLEAPAESTPAVVCQA